MPTVDREQLLLALETVTPGVGKEDDLDQASRFLLKGGRVWTFNKDLCCRIKTPLPKDFEAAVISKTLLEMLRGVQDPIVQIFRENGHVRVKAKTDEFEVNTDAEIKLPVDSVDKPGDWTILPAEFLEGVKLVKNSVATDESTEILTCVHIHPKYLEACDNYRHTKYRVRTPIENPVLVKAQSVRHVVDLGMNEISETQNWVHFRNGTGLIMSVRKWVERYPDFSPFLVKEDGHQVKFPPKMVRKLSLANVLSKEYGDNNEVTVTLSQGKVMVVGNGVTGRYRGRAKVDYTGPEKEFVIHPEQLTEIVNNYETCTVSDNKIRVDGDKYTFVALLKMTSDQEDGDGEQS